MISGTSSAAEVGEELHRWFEQLDHLIEGSVFAVAPEGPHRDAVVLNVLSRNGRRIRELDIDRQGELYGPLCFMLSAACRRLGFRLGPRHWEAAATNVASLSRQLRSVQDESRNMGLEIVSPAKVLKEQVDETLLQAGVAGAPTFLDTEGRRIALGLAVNWGIRLLCAYAWEQGKISSDPTRRDLPWIRELLRPLMQA